MEPALEIEIHEGLKRAARRQEVFPHTLKARHDRREGAFYRWWGAAPTKELGEGQNWRIVEDVQPAACVRAYIGASW